MHGQPPDGQGQPPAQPPFPPPVQPPHPPPFQGPVQPPGPPRAKRPSPLVWLAVVVAGVVVLGAMGFLLSQGGSAAPSGPVKAGQCVDAGFTVAAKDRIPASLRVDCDDAKAKAKVVKVTDEGDASVYQFAARAEPDCPAGTDGVTNARGKSTDEHYYEACARNIKAPHPGDPGVGGAFLIAGDCVSSGSIGFGKEQPCSKPGWYGKVTARVDTEKSCPSGTLETMKMRALAGGKVTRPVLCLGAGGGVLATGDCIKDPTFNLGDLDKAKCGSSDAIAKVVGRVATTSKCPAAATNYITDKGAYLPVLCLKKLRPTFDEQLRSLPG